MKKLYTHPLYSFMLLGVLSLFSTGLFAQVGIGNTDPKSTLDVSGALSLREGPALSLAAGNNATVNLGTTQYSQYRITGPTANFNIRSFNTGATVGDGQTLTLVNTTDFIMTMGNDQAPAANPERGILCPNNKDLLVEGKNGTVTLIYNKTLLRWVIMGYTDIGGYGRNIKNVLGATDINTNSATPTDMPGMSITFTPKHSKVYVNFSASGTMDKGAGGSAQAFANFELRKDNTTTVAGITTLASDRSFIDVNCGPPGTEDCDDLYYDLGGPTGDYGNSTNDPRLFTPPPGKITSVTFISFNTEANWDGLMVYDGPNASAPLISSGAPAGFNATTCPAGAYSGTGQYSAAGITFTSTHASGSLYFVFKTDSSVIRPGWEACVTYFTPIPCRETFRDLGGTGNYPLNTLQTQLYTPTNPGEKISVRFDSFLTYITHGLLIYDGPDATYPLISSGSPGNGSSAPPGSFYSSTPVGGPQPYSAAGETFVSTANTGELYFEFNPVAGLPRDGWDACVKSVEEDTDYSLDTAWNASLTMYPITVTPGVPTTLKIRWSRDGNGTLPYILRNNVANDPDRSHRSLTIFD